MTDRDLLRRIERSPGQRAGYKQLVRELSLPGGRERRLLVEHLARLTAAGKLVKLDRDHWAMAKSVATRDNLAAGRLDLHRDGYGFVRPDARQASGQEDIFIPPNEINSAMQGDQVLVELLPNRADGRKLGRIVRVLTRRNPTVVGIFHYSRNQRFPENTVTPFDDRMTQPIVIPDGMEISATLPKSNANRVLGDEAVAAAGAIDFNDTSPTPLEGLVVDIEITDFPGPNRAARGRVIEILGDPDAFGVDVEMMIRKHHLPHVFPEQVLAEAREVAHLDPETVAERRDFRDLPIVTIDGETAKDFDDAVLVEENADGTYQLQVHIADVAEYVLTGTDLDLEARLRGNSVYFPDRAVPMLPQELSTNICSLRPGEDRLVLSCLMRIDVHGEVLDYEICEGVIRSARRMTYTQVAAIIDPGRDDHGSTRTRFNDLVPAFERMYALALLLNKKRQRRGSIDFDLPEPVIEFDASGAMLNVVRSVRNWANRLIEEFMLAANECVASWIEQLGVPSIYRIHEMPEAKRVIEVEDTAAHFGYSLGIGALPVKRVQMKSDRREQQRGSRGRDHRGGHQGHRTPQQHEIAQEIPVTPQMYQRLTAKIVGKPEERILAYLMLRSLKQARYSEKNEGHFALAAPSYTHFTSPIRRYPDLVVHRIVKALLAEGVNPQGALAPGEPHAPGKHAAFRPKPRAAAPSDPALIPIPESELAAIAQETSQTERRAAEAERELIEWKKIKFMRDRVGEDFDALILNATKYGLFVELDNLFVEGLVPIDSLRDDHYTYRENTREIIGSRNHRKYFMGQRVRVILERIDAIQKRLQFALIEEETAGKRPAKAGQAKGGQAKKAKAAKPKEAKSSGRPAYKPPKAKKLKPKRKKGRRG
ncbi:3'-to-5' exoribonuclease RNase R [Acidisarcina polymorpha]|uniref:Ribonuclease R n=1 Tax=Acidisarcina polymorpha TaxID=2211140 RepID=A0A2Z5G2G6_9BACT|nr:RNB domain-containing ribonuclease [Acidisarcina polymorpha]AXC12855.1 3'-to-5' exoribonuclease RNase R [Acidisarcina polymorpha]